MKWKVYYEDIEGEIHICWIEASTEQDAMEDVKAEYWNCHEIIDVIPL